MINFLDNILGEDVFGLEGYSCANSNVFPIFEAVKFFIIIVQIAVPFGLILWGSLDWFKALIAHDEKEMRMKRKPFLARVIAAMIVLVFPWLITLISNIVAGQSNTVNFFTCYHEAKPRIDFSKWQEISEDDEGIIGGFGNTSTNSSSSGSSVEESGYVEPSGTDYSAPTSKTVKDKCSDFTSEGEAACNKGTTSTYTCQWQMGKCTEKTRRETYKTSCSDFKTYNSCNNGETETHTCQWVYEKCTEKAKK
jgi:hypothetical protein